MLSGSLQRMAFFGRVGVEKKKLHEMKSFNLFFFSYMEHGCDAWRFSSHTATMRLTKKHTNEVRVKRQKELPLVFLPLDFFYDWVRKVSPHLNKCNLLLLCFSDPCSQTLWLDFTLAIFSP